MKWIKIPLFALPVALAFTLCFVRIDDYDVWWHLKCGELFLDTGWIPRTEIFSFTAEGAPWVDGYLPMQALMYACWALGGPAGVIILGSLMTAVIYALALWMAKSSAKGLPVALAMAAPLVLMGRDQMTTRPALITPLLALVTLWLLEKKSTDRGRAIYLLIPITILWANSHPAFFLAPALTFIYAASYFFRGWKNKSADDSWAAKRLLVLIALELAATLINPYGYNIYYSLTLFATSPFLKDYIVEWLPLFGEPPGPPETGYIFVGMCAAFACVAAIFRKTVKIEHIIVFVFMAASTWYGRRNVLMMGSMALPLVAWMASDDSTWDKFADVVKKLALPLSAALCAVEAFLVWFAATNLLYLYTPTYGYRATGVGIHGSSLPVNAVKFLKDEKIPGPVFHNLDAGGFILFNLYPQNKVIIDGRCYPYPQQTFADIDESFASKERFDKVASRYGINIAVLSVGRQDNYPLIAALMTDPQWAFVLTDELSALFIRRTPETRPILNKYPPNALPGLAKFAPKRPDGDYGLFERRVYPDGLMRWGGFYSQIGRSDMAAAMYEAAYRSTPGSSWLEPWLGSELIKAGRLEDGVVYIRKALERNHDDPTALKGMGNYYLKNRDLDRAEEQFVKVVNIDPSQTSAWTNLGDIALAKGFYQVAAERFSQALKYDGGNYRIMEKLGVSLEGIDPRRAAEAYGKAIELARRAGAQPSDIERIAGRLSALMGR